LPVQPDLPQHGRAAPPLADAEDAAHPEREQSGLGRENGMATVDEYLENKSVWVELTGGTRDPFTLG
jgi:hypothetical protein